MRHDDMRRYTVSAWLLLLCVIINARATWAKLAKFEPAQGCYIGAFIERDFAFLTKPSKTKIEEFEALTQKKHASYFTYVGYGRPFPMDWVRSVKAEGAVPQIAFEPNDGLDKVQDDFYLRSWARDAARSQVPIFLRWASEMNGPWTPYGKDPAQYREKFRLVSKIMKEEAPNVAMVWTPFSRPTGNIPSYYPGDEWVDWVGVNVYAVYVHDGNPLRNSSDEDPINFVRYIYDNYAARKPVHVSEFAATIECKGTGQETVDFAIEKMTRFYTALQREFPRVKAVNWFCLNAIRSGQANNNYSFLEDGRALQTYRNLVSNNYFLSQVHYNPADFRQTVTGGTTLNANSGNTGLDELVNNSGAVAATIDQPFLRGLKPNEVIKGDLNLRAQLPIDFKPSGLIWQVDGRTMAITNAAPFRASIPKERIGEGKHSVKLIVIAKNGDTSISTEIPFTIPPYTPTP